MELNFLNRTVMTAIGHSNKMHPKIDTL